jgi:hypothetical protein
MPVDIFRFWTKIKPHEKIHPDNREVFHRVGRRGHGLDLRCLPASFNGRLRDAPVVHLFLSPGINPNDIREARTSRGQGNNAGRDFLQHWVSGHVKAMPHVQRLAEAVRLATKCREDVTYAGIPLQEIRSAAGGDLIRNILAAFGCGGTREGMRKLV